MKNNKEYEYPHFTKYLINIGMSERKAIVCATQIFRPIDTLGSKEGENAIKLMWKYEKLAAKKQQISEEEQANNTALKISLEMKNRPEIFA